MNPKNDGKNRIVYKKPSRTSNECTDETSKPKRPMKMESAGPSNLIVRHNYDPKQNQLYKTRPNVSLISPLTNKQITDVSHHLKINLLTSTWKEEKEKYMQERRRGGQVYATGDDMHSNLQFIAERRSDIFGIGNEETVIGKRFVEDVRRSDVKRTNAVTVSAKREKIGPIPHTSFHSFS